ncbi:pseudaminic acid synthase [Bacteriovorax stolpii]|uniref:pseudaminic acid synthase n=1 Tax=Bacteriovorax stolpii TaxID=960 RepID=UPI00115AD6C6|nr:pseudaminic acid synthase [Bacteriovorax stolpii]QDK43246.1 pseudaminic acid synthase [Bacteriovorax stolpii]
MKKEIKIGNRLIGLGHEPFVIAEMSGNHNQSLERALAIVDAAAKTGAHALKIQTYTPDTMTLDIKEGEFFIEDPKSLWKGKSLYDLYAEAMTPWEWHKPIKDRCEQHGMLFFSTPFDFTAVDFLEELNVDFYKIASFENTDVRLVEKVAKTGKPVIISTGMATVAELYETVEAAKKAGCKDLILLKCTSAYPSTPKEANLLTIPHLRDLFDVEVGLSDHTMGVGVSIASVALGASVIEKHFTLDRSEGGVDSAFSMEPAEFKILVEESKKAWEALGKVSYDRSERELKSLDHRRSLYISQDMKAGEVITDKNIKSIRPGHGLPTKYYNQLIGKKVKGDVKKGTPTSLELFL